MQISHYSTPAPQNILLVECRIENVKLWQAAFNSGCWHFPYGKLDDKDIEDMKNYLRQNNLTTWGGFATV